MPSRCYILLADLILLLHFGIVVFVVAGFALIWIGRFRHWSFVRRWAFRLSHLLLLGAVVVQAGTGVWCPLTVWENELRARAGTGAAYEASFLHHWIHRLLFYDLPEQAFMFAYSAFLMLIVLSLALVPPRRRPRPRAPGH